MQHAPLPRAPVSRPAAQRPDKRRQARDERGKGNDQRSIDDEQGILHCRNTSNRTICRKEHFMNMRARRIVASGSGLVHGRDRVQDTPAAPHAGRRAAGFHPARHQTRPSAGRVAVPDQRRQAATAAHLTDALPSGTTGRRSLPPGSSRCPIALLSVAARPQVQANRFERCAR